jgi:hypothetical protein
MDITERQTFGAGLASRSRNQLQPLFVVYNEQIQKYKFYIRSSKYNAHFNNNSSSQEHKK